jgi:hypothetical protein
VRARRARFAVGVIGTEVCTEVCTTCASAAPVARLTDATMGFPRNHTVCDGPCRDRTCDLGIKRQAAFRLSMRIWPSCAPVCAPVTSVDRSAALSTELRSRRVSVARRRAADASASALEVGAPSGRLGPVRSIRGRRGVDAAKHYGDMGVRERSRCRSMWASFGGPRPSSRRARRTDSSIAAGVRRGCRQRPQGAGASAHLADRDALVPLVSVRPSAHVFRPEGARLRGPSTWARDQGRNEL